MLEEFVPPRDEFTSLDLMMRQGEDGGVRAYIAVGVNGNLLAMSRGAWELMMPRLLQLIYGGRMAEALVFSAMERTAGAGDDEALAVLNGAMNRFGQMVLAPHPLEMFAA